MVLLEFRVTDHDYKYDEDRKSPVVTRNQAGFMCCFGQDGYIFGYGIRMLSCRPFKENWASILMNPGPRQLETTYSHGLFVDKQAGITWECLDLYDIQTSKSRRRTRRRRELLNYAYAHIVTYLLIRLQRWFRIVLDVWRSKRLAVAMSMHTRLGCNSGLGSLGVDLMLVVLENRI